MTEHGWAYQFRVRGGRVGADTPRVVGELRGVDSGTNPELLLERTDEFNTGTAMLDASDGTEYVRPLRGAAKMRSGKRYGVGLVACDGLFGYGLLPADQVASGDNTRIYRRSLATPTPQDPMAYTQSTGSFGWLAASIDYEPNVAPDVPSDLSPVDGATGLDLTPTFSGNFRDDNETLPNGLDGDELGKYQIIVWQDEPNGVVLWNPVVNASSAEKAARQWSTVYDGPTLSLTDTYAWAARVQDDFGVWSEFTEPRTFQCGGPSVTVTGPSGKVDTLSPTLTATYEHPGGLDAAGYMVELLDGDTLAQLGGSMFKPVAPGSVPPGSLLSDDQGGLIDFPLLEWGGRYRISWTAEDSAGDSSKSDPGPLFYVNAPPSIPLIIGPDDGEIVTSLPEVIAIATDDDDNVASGHVVSLEILDSDGDVLQTRAMTLDTSLTDWAYPIWRYQLTSSDITTTGTFRLRAYAYDGSVYSGGHTSSATRSEETVFVYSAGPAITHTSPANLASVATNTPLYDWTVTDQQRMQVEVYQTFEDGSDLLIYDSGETAQTATHHTQPAGYLEDDTSYYRKVHVWNSLNQHGISTAAYFTVNYTKPPAPSNVVASGYSAEGDPDGEPSGILFSFDPLTGYTDAQHKAYRITRRVASESPVDVDDPVGYSTVIVADLAGIDDTSYVDLTPASGVTYVYGVRAIVVVDGITLMSSTTEVEASVSFGATIICDARRGTSRRAVLLYRRDRETENEREQSFETPWGSSKPTAIRSKRWNRVVNCEFKVIGETAADVAAVIRQLDAMDYSGGPLCWRDGRGERMFGEITSLRKIDPPGGRVRRIVVGFRQTGAVETFV